MRIPVGSRTLGWVLFLTFASGYGENNDASVLQSSLLNSDGSVVTEINSDQSTKIVFSREFYIAPNPVTKTDSKCNFYLNPLQKGTAELRIFDPAGNEIFSYNSSVNKYGNNKELPFFSWNMKNKKGRFVGKGTYLAIVTFRSDDGTVSTYKNKIGYKE